MKSKTTSKPFVNLIGCSSGTIKRIKNIICFRKPLDIVKTKKIMSSYKYAIGMVSAHNIYRKPNTPYCKAWCHCFKDPEKYLGNKPKILLSESDFVDPDNIIVFQNKPAKWDFFYFTMGGDLGKEYKGIDIFVRSLPILCGKYRLKGIVIKYAYSDRKFYLNTEERKIYNTYKKNFVLVNRCVSSEKIASIMSQCHFGFFPNARDCSPLLVAESIVRNCPVLIHQHILGGWKYADGEMGISFTLDNLCDQVEKIMENSFSPRDRYMQTYGYENSARRLASFCKQNYKEIGEFSMIAFDGTDKTMRLILNKKTR